MLLAAVQVSLEEGLEAEIQIASHWWLGFLSSSLEAATRLGLSDNISIVKYEDLWRVRVATSCDIAVTLTKCCGGLPYLL